MGILGIAAAQPEQERTGLMSPVAAGPRNQSKHNNIKCLTRPTGGFLRL